MLFLLLRFSRMSLEKLWDLVKPRALLLIGQWNVSALVRGTNLTEFFPFRKLMTKDGNLGKARNF